MNNKKIYTNKNFEEGFPKPGIPEDDAWKQMHELLVKNDLTSTQKKDKRKSLLLLLLIFLLIGIAGISVYLLSVKKNNHEVVAIQKNTESKTHSHNDYKTKLPSKASENINFNKIDALKTPDKTSDADVKNHLLSVNTNKSLSIKNNMLEADGSGEATDYSINNFQQLVNDDRTKNNAGAIDSATKQIVQNDTAGTDENNNNINRDSSVPLKNVAGKSKPGKFTFGLQWNINFSTLNNSHYFDAYNGNKQYYMWLLPSAWARMTIVKKQGILLHFNPYSQQFAGNQVVNIEKPFIASVEPDIVTKLIKSRGYNIGLKYEFNVTNKISVAAGLSYTIQHDALYLQQVVEGYSGNVLSDSIYAAKKNDAAFKYVKSSYANWNGSVKYNFGKINVAAGISRPINNLSSNPDYKLRPLNAELYLQYRIK